LANILISMIREPGTKPPLNLLVRRRGGPE
jgi:hypothetical protein